MRPAPRCSLAVLLVLTACHGHDPGAAPSATASRPAAAAPRTGASQPARQPTDFRSWTPVPAGLDPCTRPAPTAPDAPTVPPRFRGSLQVLTLPAGEHATPTRKVFVYRPPGPDSARYPVIYLLHGLPGTAGSALHVSGARGDADLWAATGHTPVVIAVPEGQSNAVEDTEWGDDVRGRFHLESWVLHTVVPAVEGRYRRPAGRRAVIGFSMGAFGAMDYALRHRDVFGQVAALGGYWQLEDPDGVFGASPATRDPWRPLLLARRARGGRFLVVSSCHSKDAPMVDALRRNGGSVTHLRLVGGHTWLLVRDNFPTLLAWLGAGWR